LIVFFVAAFTLPSALGAEVDVRNHTNMLELTSTFNENDTESFDQPRFNITSNNYSLNQQGKEDFRKAVTLSDYGRYDEAITYLDRVLDVSPSYVQGFTAKVLH